MTANITYKFSKKIGAQDTVADIQKEIDKIIEKYKNNPDIVVNIEVKV